MPPHNGFIEAVTFFDFFPLKDTFSKPAGTDLINSLIFSYNAPEDT